MVSTAVALGAMVLGANDLAAVGAAITVRPLAVTLLVTRAVAPMLAAVLLYGPPTTFEVTSTVTTHDACALLSEAPVTVMLPLPAAALTAPAPDGHVVVMLGAAATSTLAGSVSVKLMPDCAGLPAPFANVNVSVEIPPWLIVVGAQALLSEACTTVIVWFATTFTGTPPTLTFAAPLVYPPAVALVTSTESLRLQAPAAAFTPEPPSAKAPVPAVAGPGRRPPPPLTP